MKVHTNSAKSWIAILAELSRKYRLSPGDTVHILDFGSVLSIIP